jgi:hypothetical protein
LVDLAAERGEPVELLRRIAAVHGALPRSHKWVPDRSRLVGDAYAAAAGTGRVDPADIGRGDSTYRLLRARFGTEWELVGSILVLQPCSACGGTERVPLRLREADGSVCLSCRTDRSGVPWPSEYDRYAHPVGRSPARA